MSRTLSLDVLDNLRVASPCSMTWNQLDRSGDAGDRIRHCGQCDLHVYNIANLSREETIDLIAGHAASGERLCAMLFRRVDGTLLMRDCPVGIAAMRRKALAVASRIAAGVLLGVSVAFVTTVRSGGNRQPSVSSLEPLNTSVSWLQRTAARLAGGAGGPVGAASSTRTMGSLATSHIKCEFPRNPASDPVPKIPGLPRNPDGSINLFSASSAR